MISVLVSLSLVLAAVPCGLFLLNLLLYRRLPVGKGRPVPAVSVLIPARNEAANIGAAVASVLLNQNVELEVVVLDDASEDATAAIVREIAARDHRVRLAVAPALPPGWCGKMHACHVLAGLARHPVLVFLDADVRLAPDALRRLAAALDAGKADLLSGVPRQITRTALERMLIPLIHFVLLGFLPLFLARRWNLRGFGAGCGQLFAARADAYARSGGHAAIRTTLHDGVKLPRLFRSAGLRTDIFDATDLASCRMYDSAGAVWRGLGKNATEGLAAPGLILPMTFFLFGGQILPWLLLPVGGKLAGMAVLLSILPRLTAAVRFRQSFWGVVSHPVAVLLLLVIQWQAWARRFTGAPSTWKGRDYAVRPAAEVANAARVALALLLGSALWLSAGNAPAAETNAPVAATNTVRLASFELTDQFGEQRKLEFPNDKMIFLTVADHKGSQQIAAWVQPVQARYGDRIRIEGIAAVAAVPRLLRPVVRRGIRSGMKYPLMLDWEGKIAPQLAPVADAANIYVVARTGEVLWRTNGPVNDAVLARLYAQLDAGTNAPAQPGAAR
ncbi:MAG TPA: glycosyltransferase family 2 protein [Dongiaceae bacterium]|nr:glycosyltransferase family 2 protein [Dongiaceae bacterium]